jgi:hypothetical protein
MLKLSPVCPDLIAYDPDTDETFTFAELVDHANALEGKVDKLQELVFIPVPPSCSANAPNDSQRRQAVGGAISGAASIQAAPGLAPALFGPRADTPGLTGGIIGGVLGCASLGPLPMPVPRTPKQRIVAVYRELLALRKEDDDQSFSVSYHKLLDELAPAVAEIAVGAVA